MFLVFKIHAGQAGSESGYFEIRARYRVFRTDKIFFVPATGEEQDGCEKNDAERSEHDEK